MENPEAQWKSRYWITHKTRWNVAASSKYSQCSIRGPRYKLVMPKAGVHELYDLETDIHEKTNIAAQHPDKVASLKKEFDAWWEDIQPYMVNDHLAKVPESCKPYHEIYRRDFGQERFDEAMRLMTWTGGKRVEGAAKTKKPRRKKK